MPSRDTENASGGGGLWWHRVKVHAVVRPAVGWYGCFHVVAPSRDDVERILTEFAAFIGIQSVVVAEWYECEPAHPHERMGFRQEGGRITYDESVEADPSEEVRYSVPREPFSTISRWLWRRRIRRFNARLRRRGLA